MDGRTLQRTLHVTQFWIEEGVKTLLQHVYHCVKVKAKLYEIVCALYANCSSCYSILDMACRNFIKFSRDNINYLWHD